MLPANKTDPMISSGASDVSSLYLGNITNAVTSAIARNGMLTQKIECQLKLSIKREPINGPRAAPSPAPRPKKPNTFGRRFSDTTWRMMAMLFGVSKAPPAA